MTELGGREGVLYDPAMIAWIREQLEPAWWHSAAACRSADPELFFLDRGDSAAAAKRICARCPVQPACLEFALSEKPSHGIWAGMTPKELRQHGRPPEEAPKVSPKSKISEEQKRRRRLASTLADDGATLIEIAKRLHVSPAQALGYLSEEQQTAVLAGV